MKSMIVITDFLWSFILFHGFGYSGGSIFVSTTNINCIVAHESSKTSINVSGEHTSDDVA